MPLVEATQATNEAITAIVRQIEYLHLEQERRALSKDELGMLLAMTDRLAQVEQGRLQACTAYACAVEGIKGGRRATEFEREKIMRLLSGLPK